jgi:hypothetical protein
MRIEGAYSDLFRNFAPILEMTSKYHHINLPHLLRPLATLFHHPSSIFPLPSSLFLRLLVAIMFNVQCSMLNAQESRTTLDFLRLPISAHVSSLGGDNVSLTDDDATLVFHNPALINFVSDKTINLNYMTYMEGCKTASASFVRGLTERSSWAVTGQYMDYGKMKQTTADNQLLGDFSARDIAVGGTFAYALTNQINGGISAKFISSSIASYNALAVGVDLGLNYCDSVGDFSVSLVARNLGGQVKAYDDEFERIPFDLQLGLTKRLTNSPLRFSVTLTRLHDWSEPFGRHLNIGADLLLGENIYVAAGYNFRRAHEMKISDSDGSSAHGAGLSLGAGISLERLKLHLGYGKYHVSASSLLFNISYAL